MSRRAFLAHGGGALPFPRDSALGLRWRLFNYAAAAAAAIAGAATTAAAAPVFLRLLISATLLVVLHDPGVSESFLGSDAPGRVRLHHLPDLFSSASRVSGRGKPEGEGCGYEKKLRGTKDEHPTIFFRLYAAR